MKKANVFNLKLSLIKISSLKKFSVEGGDVMHALKSSDTGYRMFGEIYFSWINSLCIKAWKKHKIMTKTRNKL